MDLSQKTLQSLRDLALRMGIATVTSYTKSELIEKIEERKKELESENTTACFNPAVSPRRNNSFISIVKNDDGTISFCDEQPQETTPNHAPRQPVITDGATKEKLEEAANILRTLYLAIDTILENS